MAFHNSSFAPTQISLKDGNNLAFALFTVRCTSNSDCIALGDSRLVCEKITVEGKTDYYCACSTVRLVCLSVFNSNYMLKIVSVTVLVIIQSTEQMTWFIISNYSRWLDLLISNFLSLSHKRFNCNSETLRAANVWWKTLSKGQPLQWLRLYGEPGIPT